MTVKVKPKIPKGAVNSSETAQDKIRNENVILSGLTINTREYFVICVAFFKPRGGRLKCQKLGKISTPVVC